MLWVACYLVPVFVYQIYEWIMKLFFPKEDVVSKKECPAAAKAKTEGVKQCPISKKVDADEPSNDETKSTEASVEA